MFPEFSQVHEVRPAKPVSILDLTAVIEKVSRGRTTPEDTTTLSKATFKHLGGRGEASEVTVVSLVS